MWTVVYIAANRNIGEFVKSKMEKEGLLAVLRPLNFACASDACQFELLVPESEAEEAQEILSSLSGR